MRQTILHLTKLFLTCIVPGALSFIGVLFLVRKNRYRDAGRYIHEYIWSAALAWICFWSFWVFVLGRRMPF